MCQSDLSAGNGAKLPPHNSGTQGIAEQRYIASMQTGQDKQQTNSRSARDSQMTMQGQCTKVRPPQGLATETNKGKRNTSTQIVLPY